MAETREKLIAAARKTFAARGYVDSPMEDITAEAVSYTHLPTLTIVLPV